MDSNKKNLNDKHPSSNQADKMYFRQALPLINGVVFAVASHIAFMWLVNYDIELVDDFVSIGLYQFRILQSLLVVAAYFVPVYLFVYLFINGTIANKQKKLYRSAKAQSKHKKTLFGTTEFKVIKKMENSAPYSKFAVFIMTFVDTLFAIWLTILVPVALDGIFMYYEIDMGILAMIVSGLWLLGYTVFHILYNVKSFYGIAVQRGLYSSLTVLFVCAFVINNVNLYGIYAFYNPFDTYTQNVEIQKEMNRLFSHYADLITQWSLIQAIVFTILDRKELHKKVNEKIQKIEKDWDDDTD